MKPEPFLNWLFSALSGNANLSALVGARIFPDAAPGGTANPCAVYQFLRDDFEDLLDAGAIENGEIAVQFRCYGSNRKDANAVREAVRQQMQNLEAVNLSDAIRIEGARWSDAEYTFDRDTEDYGSLAVVTFYLGANQANAGA
jgi:hypothetical protein